MSGLSTPAELAAIFRAARCVLLDFDGPVCDLFAGQPASQVADGLRVSARARGDALTELALATDDPLEVLREAATASPSAARAAEADLSAAELVIVRNARPTPGARDFLDACQAAGLPVAIVSNNSESAIRAYLDAKGLTPLVQHVVGRPAGDPRLMKPSPHLLATALNLLNVDASIAVMVGDSLTDIQAAKALGTQVIAYANRAHKMTSLSGAHLLVSSMSRLAESLSGLKTQ